MLLKATRVEDVINYFDSQQPLPPNDPRYVDTGRREIDTIKNNFLATNRELKFLFGGHPGNGKSTELKKIARDERINAKYLVVAYNAKDVLDLNDVDIIDLLLSMALKILEKAENLPGITLTPYLQKQLEEMAGYFTEKLYVEQVTAQTRSGQIGIGVEAKTGFRFPIVALCADFFAKMCIQSETRKLIRENYRFKITDLRNLVNDIILSINKPILLIIDDLDKIEPQQAEKLFFDQGYIIGQIKTNLLLTLPISMIYSPKSTIIASQIGQLKVLRNLRLRNSNGQEDELTEKNRDWLRQIVYHRMEKGLIDDDALDMAIDACGGVYRTLIEIIPSASSSTCLHNGKKIDSNDMQEAVNEERATKKRGLNRTYCDILLEIYDHKSVKTIINSFTKETLELFHSLFALEYMNGEEWCDIHPLLVKEIEDYRRIKQNEQTRSSV